MEKNCRRCEAWQGLVPPGRGCAGVVEGVGVCGCEEGPLIGLHLDLDLKFDFDFELKLELHWEVDSDL